MSFYSSYKSVMGKVLVLLLSVGILAGCVVKPIYNVEDRSFNTEEIIPLANVERRIRLIGADRGWTFKNVAPGHLIGSVGTHKHKASVDLYFNQKTFSIKYRDSHNLKASGSTIHHRYNRWVEILEHDLAAKVGLMRD